MFKSFNLGGTYYYTMLALVPQALYLSQLITPFWGLSSGKSISIYTKNKRYHFRGERLQVMVRNILDQTSSFISLEPP